MSQPEPARQHMHLLFSVLIVLVTAASTWSMAGCGASPMSAARAPATSPAASPTISSISPATVPAGSGAFTLTVNGSAFTSASTVQLNGASETTTFVNATELQAVVPAAQIASATSLQVAVQTGQSTTAAAQAPTLVVSNPVPAIASLSPASVPAGSTAFSLAVTGTGFVPASAVSLAGSPLATTFVSATELHAAVPAGVAAAGAALSVTVANPAPGGGSSPAVPFLVTAPPPTITGLSPQAVPAGAAATILLNGTGFEANSVVLWNGAPRPTTFGNAAMLQVGLTSADLAAVGNGTLSVSNPGPGASDSAPSTLIISGQTGPVIQNVALSILPQSGGCDQVQATITGSNFTFPSGVQVDGIPLLPSSFFVFSPYKIVATLPLLGGANSLAFTVSNNATPALTSPPFRYPASAPPILSICATPNPAVVYPATSFSATLTALAINLGSTPTVSLGALPAGITTQAPASLAIPAGGVVVPFAANASVAAGTYSIPLAVQSGASTDKATLELTVSEGKPPATSWLSPLLSEADVTIGSSAQLQFTLAQGYPQTDYNVMPSVSGLPPGVTASFDPAVLIPGQSTTLTLQAAANAPVSMNTTVTVTGTADAPVSPATIKFLLDVTNAPGTRPNNGTDFTSTGGTPYAAAYDSSHQLIFSSNPAWDRVDVLDARTHALVHQLSIRDPRGLDIASDGSKVWVATGSRLMVAIDPSTLSMTGMQLPLFNGASWEGASVFALADGTLLLNFGDNMGDRISYAAVWNPATNTLTSVAATFALAKSGDGTHVYFYADNHGQSCQLQVYSTATASLSNVPQSTGDCPFAAVNQDGSRFIFGGSGKYEVYDGSFTLIGSLPTNPTSGSAANYQDSSFFFDPHGSTLYQFMSGSGPDLLATINIDSLTLTGAAPALPALPINTSDNPAVPAYFGVNSNGLLLGIKKFGLSFEDPTFFQHFAPSEPGVNYPALITPPAGPLTGGTVSSLYGIYALTPDVFYGGSRGTASVDNSHSLTVTSPANTNAGPVNLKLLFPDGNQILIPQTFSYGPYPQYSILSGASPLGGVPGELSGYGLPADAGGGSVTIGSSNAAITTKVTQYPPYTGEPFPSTFLNYTVPAGTPGWADLEVTTPSGTGTLPKAVFYANSVTDYPSPDAAPGSLTAVLYDEKRRQVYISAGDHIDVFSLQSHQYLEPLHPAGQGGAKLFTGLALTPDGTNLLAADLLDGSLAVINPDAPAGGYAIPIAAAQGTASCMNGPLYVAATSTNLAFLTYGGLPGLSCPSEGLTYVAGLQQRAAIRASARACGIGYLPYPFTDGFSVDSPADGSFVAIGASSYSKNCIYSASANAFSVAPGRLQYGLGLAAAGDGNVLASGVTLADPAGNLLGRLARPTVEFGTSPGGYNEADVPSNSLPRPRLNSSGSLYYWAYPKYFDILDVAHGTLRIRFSLSETVTNTAQPIAVDADGRQVFLLTDKGLTVVDLGTAPLSIGHLEQTTAAAGTQVLVRGSGFVSGTTATVGHEAAVVAITDNSTLTFTMPALSSGLQDLVLTNPDGTTYTLQSAIAVP